MPVVAIAVDVGALAAGLLLLAFIAASFPTIYRAVAALLGGIPFIGGWVESNVQAIVLRMLATMSGWVDQGIGPVTALVSNATAQAINLGYGALDAVNWAYASLYHLATVTIPATLAQAVAYANQQVAALEGRVLAALAILRAEMLADFKLATEYALALFNVAQATAQRLYLAALAYVDQQVAAALATALRAVLAVRAELQAAVQELQGLIRLAELQAHAYTDQGVSRAIGYADTVGQAARVYSDQQTAAAEGQATAQNAALATALAAGLATAATAIQSIEDSPCMQECQTLGNLGQALDAIDLLALLALAEEALRDPGGTAQFLRTYVAPLAQDAVAAGADVIGYRV